MKKFLFKILLFLLPVGSLLTLVYYIKTERYFCYNYIKGDCDGRGLNLYHKIYKEKKSVDYLFIGSSKTMNGINDSMIERLINFKQAQHIKLFNAGYCRYGRNFEALLLKEFLKFNSIKTLFLEVRQDESTNGHPMFPFVADGTEILSGISALNTGIFSDMYNHFLMNLKFTRCKFNFDYCDSTNVPDAKFGYNNINKIIEPEELDKFFTEKTKEWRNFSVNKNALEYKFSNYYLKEIKTLCEKNNVELYFIYLPGYGNIIKIPAFEEEYKKMGRLILAPDSIFENKTYWKDNGHFNTFGADAYSKFLAKTITH